MGKGIDNRLFYEEVGERIDYLRNVLDKKTKTLTKSPKGKIVINHHHSGFQYYVREHPTDKRGRYLKTSEKELTKRLIQKRYDELIVKQIQKELDILEQLNTTTNPYEEIYNKIHVGCDMVTPLMLTDEECVKKWYECQYDRMGFAENAPEYYSKKGERMRSKSETVIADHLDKYGVPYLYECPIEIDGKMYYPDFKILNVHTREVIYWEHFGIMDDSDYMNKAIKKINTYAQNGLVLGENLIVTFESVRTPLDYKVVDAQIKTYCL